MFATNCAWAWAWLNAPMIPNPIRVSPFRMNAGMIVCSGRLRGASAFGCVSSSVKSAPRFCSAKPVPGGTIALPNPR